MPVRICASPGSPSPSVTISRRLPDLVIVCYFGISCNLSCWSEHRPSRSFVSACPIRSFSFHSQLPLSLSPNTLHALFFILSLLQQIYKHFVFMKSLPSPSDPEAGEALLGSCPRCDLDAEKGALLSRPENGQRSLYQKWIPHWLQIAMLWLNLSALFIVLLGFWLGGYSIVSPKAIDGICFEKTSIFSSAAKSVDLSYHEKTFSELTLQKDNIYRQDASPEVDAAWADLGVHCLFSLFSSFFGILS